MRSLMLFVVLGLCVATFPVPLAAKNRRKADDLQPAKAVNAKWLVRVEVLMVQMTQAQALALVPGLRDPRTVDESFAKVMAAIEQKQAILVGYPVVSVLDGAKGVSETILEKRYPTEFDPATGDESVAANKAKEAPAKGNLIDKDLVIPTAFETRNIGVTLEVEARVLGTGEWIYVEAYPQHVTFLGTDGWVPPGEEARSLYGRFGQPEFSDTKTRGELIVRNGRRVLLGVHTLEKPAGQVEVHILQASAEAVGK